MCGRYTLTVPLSNLVDAFDVPPPDFEFRPRFNIAPTQEVPVVARDRGGRRIGLLRWGLVPGWARDPAVGSRMINARGETVSEKPAFRSAFRRRRCLVPADGFYEWKKEGKGGSKAPKVPHWIHLAPGRVFGMAGLWEGWTGEGEETLHTYTIITTEAAESIAHVHPRMPVILPAESWEGWLDPDADPQALQRLLRPYPSRELRARPVSTRVNSPRNDDPECLKALPG